MTPNSSNQKKFYILIPPVINRTHPSNQKKFYMLLYPVSFAPAAFHQKVSTHKIYSDKYHPNQKETFYPPPVSALQSSKPPTKRTHNIGKLKGKKVLFAEGDIALQVSVLDRDKLGIETVKDDDADDAMIRGDEGTVISYTVAPAEPASGSRCYKMLIDTGDHTLYYFKRHHISGKAGAGFSLGDLHSIASHNKK